MYYILYRTTMYMYRTALIRHVHVLSQYKLHIRFETTFTAAGGDERGHSSGRWGCQGWRMAHPLAARSSKAQWRAFLHNLVDTEDPAELTQRSVWWRLCKQFGDVQPADRSWCRETVRALIRGEQTPCTTKATKNKRRSKNKRAHAVLSSDSEESDDEMVFASSAAEAAYQNTLNVLNEVHVYFWPSRKI
eukprot:COSAG02_NODE_6313_length_3659_cov_122.161798_3_plen_190_part_00